MLENHDGKQIKEGCQVGILVDEEFEGKNNGSIGGVMFFQTKNNRGVFVQLSEIEEIPSEEEKEEEKKDIQTQVFYTNGFFIYFVSQQQQFEGEMLMEELCFFIQKKIIVAFLGS